MSTGEQAWMVPIGTGPRKILSTLGITPPDGDLGWPRRTHVLLTPHLLFAAQAGVFNVVGVHFRDVIFPNSMKMAASNDDPALRVLDPDSGKLLAKVPLPSNAYGAPMTYSIQGKQYIVVPVGGGGTNTDAGLVALSVE
jgi:quinoprotein glucose dehydrogenase